ncbi:MAG: hypothetical protein J6S82_10125, partial [Bacteroidales bacterium]|nr:hypothetical protein [Bacteroidales bacterium]
DTPDWGLQRFYAARGDKVNKAHWLCGANGCRSMFRCKNLHASAQAGAVAAPACRATPILTPLSGIRTPARLRRRSLRVVFFRSTFRRTASTLPAARVR